jgi:hypothetical protein
LEAEAKGGDGEEMDEDEDMGKGEGEGEDEAKGEGNTGSEGGDKGEAKVRSMGECVGKGVCKGEDKGEGSVPGVTKFQCICNFLPHSSSPSDPNLGSFSSDDSSAGNGATGTAPQDATTRDGDTTMASTYEDE